MQALLLHSPSTTIASFLLAATVVLLTACGSSAGVTEQAPPETPPLSFPDALTVGGACDVVCPNGDNIDIICAAGETPTCDCDATPRTQCLGSAAN